MARKLRLRYVTCRLSYNTMRMSFSTAASCCSSSRSPANAELRALARELHPDTALVQCIPPIYESCKACCYPSSPNTDACPPHSIPLQTRLSLPSTTQIFPCHPRTCRTAEPQPTKCRLPHQVSSITQCTSDQANLLPVGNATSTTIYPAAATAIFISSDASSPTATISPSVIPKSCRGA